MMKFGLKHIIALSLLVIGWQPVSAQTEEAEETMGLLSGSKIVEEATDVFLEEDDDGKDA